MVTAKRRPMIVVSQAPTNWPPGGARLNERGFACVPVFSFHDNDPAELRARIRSLEYPAWLHLPADELRHVKEGFARLDRMQVVEQSALVPMRVALADEALFFLSEWLRFYLTEDIESVFIDDRKALMAALTQQPPTAPQAKT